MSTDKTQIISNKGVSQLALQLDQLGDLLQKQIKLAQQGNISDVEVLSGQAGSLVKKIAQTGIPESGEFKGRKEQLRKSYEDLCLALSADKAEAAKRLSEIHKGKRTIKTYRDNI